jgi:hypothetical protein
MLILIGKICTFMQLSTTDVWTLIQNMNYTCVTEHFIDPS